jgi:uncharacterized protein involved in outer membrane biogenesis
MSGTVKNIFKVLIIAIVCLVVGAFLINVLAPNATNQVTNAIEQQVWKATGISLDLNGDGYTGQNGGKATAGANRSDKSNTIAGKGGGNTVTGFSRDK